MQRSNFVAHRSWFVLLALAALWLTTLACGFEGGAFSSTPESPPPGSTATLPAVGQTQSLSVTPTVVILLPNVATSGSGQPAGSQSTTDEAGAPAEALLITSPQPGQGMRGSIHIEGFSAANLNQVRILIRDVKGTVIGTASPSVQAQPDGRNKFSADVLLAANFPAQTGRVVVYAVDANNNLLHLASVDVQLNGDAKPAAAPIDPKTPEGIIIVLPNPGAQVKGVVKVSAATMLGPDVVVEVHDANGKTIGRVQQKVDMTQMPAQVLAEVPIQVTQAGPGQILVYALNPRDGQAEHLNSIEVQLAP
jgi:hypothetical protein